MADILIIDRAKSFAMHMAKDLARHDIATTYCNSITKAIGLLHTGNYKAVLLDEDLSEGKCLDYIAAIREIPPYPEVIVVSQNGDPTAAEQTIQNGAWDYITKPLSIHRIVAIINRVKEYHTERQAYRAPVSLRREGIIGNSHALQACLDKVAQASASDTTVLITGKTGTGKELFAKAIHKNSVRAKKPFIIVDCAALPETLAGNLLFGHERGAYTSADSSSIGLIKQADGGTLFLDEIGELPLVMQKVFLRVLEGRSFRPVGGVKEITSDFRLLAATNRNLEDMVTTGEFRQDLFYRLRGIHIQLPPLQTISEDINDLTCHFIRRHCQQLKIDSKGFSPDFLNALMLYKWPGNIRELINTIEQAISRAEAETVLYPRHLPRTMRAQIARREFENNTPKTVRQKSKIADTANYPDLKTYRNEQTAGIEKRYLKDLIEITNGDIKQSCHISGLSRARFYALIKQHGITRRSNR
ncbi:sigma-54-dependent transcriptional regulator [Maridesulfovibrio zosterae]|uniref:sigma-54-dependent transcriptional regulator n=1 Tax=Maridesulfovibrio zosterae TaxID=82171 RepID=UPI0003F6E303|nr:sigma-54 dependent transcriptional regulator [Maridesulfovibrio zosterae]